MAVAPRLTRTEIEEYLALETRRKSLQRQARDLDKQAEVIEAKLLDFVRAKGGDEKTALSCGYRLAIVPGKISVPWKHEFILAVSLKAAEELIKAATPGESLIVEAVE